MLRYILLCLYIFCLVSASHLHSQDHRCDTDYEMDKLYAKDPAYYIAIEKGFEDFNRMISSTRRSFEEIVIPVHVIIVHKPNEPVGTGYNLSDQHVFSQIEVINQDFRRTNADTVNTPSVFSTSDTGISFCLANIDPNGNPTSGVTRYPTDLDFRQNEFTIKEATGWDRDQYLNIWVTDYPNLGFARIPSTTTLPDPVLDGIIVKSESFGGPGYSNYAPYNLGRTATHEIGHFLGLRHIWAGNGCGFDDGIADTPLQDTFHFGCPRHPMPSCGNNGDMFMNYLDYVDDSCMNAFSTQQGDYMRTILNSSRISLKNAANSRCTQREIDLELIESTKPSCFDSNDGSILVRDINGNTNIQYFINQQGPLSSPTFTNLNAGTYTITASLANYKDSITVTIDAPDLIEIEMLDIIPVSCGTLNSGQVIVLGSGGTAPYTYKLNEEENTTGEFGNLNTGMYSLTITDYNQCSIAQIIEIDEVPAFQQMFTIKSPSCENVFDGEIKIEIEGGTPPYIITIDGQTAGPTIEQLPIGNYIIIIEDQEGCQSVDTISLTSSEIVFQSIEYSTAVCPNSRNGFLLVETSHVSNPILSINGEIIQDSFIENLSPGDYYIELSNDQGCVIDTTITIRSAPLIQPSLTIDNNKCSGDTNGSITISILFGDGPFEYQVGSSGFSQFNSFGNLESRRYNVQIKDVYGCILDTSALITSPPPITHTLNTNIDPCGFNSEATLIVEGGVAPYSLIYGFDTLRNQINESSETVINQWPDSILSIIDALGCPTEIQIGATTPAWTIRSIDIDSASCDDQGLGSIFIKLNENNAFYNFSLAATSNNSGFFGQLNAGSHLLAISDNQNCIQNIKVIVPFKDTDLTIENLSSKDVTCFEESDGSIALVASGGSGEYLYALNNLTPQTVAMFNNLIKGTYYTSVIDQLDQCSYQYTVNIDEPNQLMLTHNIIYGDQFNEVVLSANGGFPPYKYKIDNGSFGIDSIFNNVAPGIINAQVKDANDCITEVQIIVSSNKYVNSKLPTINIFPNPFTEQFKVELTNLKITDPIVIEVFDTQGKLVANKRIDPLGQNKISQTFFTKDLNTLIYIVKIAQGNEIIYRRVVKK